MGLLCGTEKLNSSFLPSTSHWYYPFGFVHVAPGAEKGPSSHTLHDLLERHPGNKPEQVYAAIQAWLMNKLRLPEERLLIDKEVECFKDLQPLGTSPRKRPDVQITSTNNKVLVQVEVESSNSKDATHRGSVMYNVPDDWTLDQVDWRQLGIMVYAFLNTGTTYHSQEPRANSRFLKHLLECGEYRPA